MCTVEIMDTSEAAIYSMYHKYLGARNILIFQTIIGNEQSNSLILLNSCTVEIMDTSEAAIYSLFHKYLGARIILKQINKVA